MSNLATEMKDLSMSVINSDKIISEVTREIRASAYAGKFDLTVEIRTDILSKVQAYLEEQGFTVKMIAHSIPQRKTIININWE